MSGTVGQNSPYLKAEGNHGRVLIVVHFVRRLLATRTVRVGDVSDRVAVSAAIPDRWDRRGGSFATGLGGGHAARTIAGGAVPPVIVHDPHQAAPLLDAFSRGGIALFNSLTRHR